mgnify:CR=1 FL=1
MDRFRQLWHNNGGVTHKEPVFRDTLFTWDHLGVTHQFTISLFDQNGEETVASDFCIPVFVEGFTLSTALTRALLFLTCLIIAAILSS